MEAFIEERCSTQPSGESYRTNLRRLAWFCNHIGHSSVRQFVRENWKSYERFLHRPPSYAVMQPTTAGKKAFSYAYGDARWRPFRGPLSDESVRHAQTVAKSFFEWLASVGVVEHNPVLTTRAKKKKRVSVTASGISRFIPEDMLRFVDEGIERIYALRDQGRASTESGSEADTLTSAEPADGRARSDAARTHERERSVMVARARWVCRLGLLSGLRASEMAKASTGGIAPSRAEKGAFLLHVERKGGKQAQVPLMDEVLDELETYVAACGLAWSRTERTGDFPLVMNARSRGNHGASRGQIWRIVKMAMHAAAAVARESGDVDAAQHLEGASTHWLRHSFATSLIEAGTDLPVVRDLMDHGNIATTNQYVHTIEKQLRGGLAKLAAKRAASEV